MWLDESFNLFLFQLSSSENEDINNYFRILRTQLVFKQKNSVISIVIHTNKSIYVNINYLLKKYVLGISDGNSTSIVNL
jgi:hypothetical protein